MAEAPEEKPKGIGVNPFNCAGYELTSIQKRSDQPLPDASSTKRKQVLCCKPVHKRKAAVTRRQRKGKSKKLSQSNAPPARPGAARSPDQRHWPSHRFLPSILKPPTSLQGDIQRHTTKREVPFEAKKQHPFQGWRTYEAGIKAV